jgi:hypothetical protein
MDILLRGVVRKSQEHLSMEVIRFRFLRIVKMDKVSIYTYSLANLLNKPTSTDINLYLLQERLQKWENNFS